jgi:diguanylate cyclase (GGDEF)-like protein/PAS domain S-box-containing protein
MEAKVFVVDDDASVRDAIALLLQSESIPSECYATAEEFLDAYRPEIPGCLVLDLTMPGMSGLELQQTLSDRHIRIPIIFITGHGEVPESVRAIRAGAFDFIEKPFDNELLLRRVREAIDWDLNFRREESERTAEAIRLYAESIVETVRQPLLVLDHYLDVLSGNGSFYETFQFEDCADKSECFNDFMNRLWAVPGLRQQLEEISTTHSEIQDFEIDIDFPRVGHKTLLLTARQLHQTGQPGRLLLALEDITASKESADILFEEKERAQITLQSIGEAVITTDALGRVESLNPIAEQLTGWSREEAQGRKVQEVFNVVDEFSRESVADLQAEALQQGRIFRLEDHSLLISRDGREYAIQDSVAPIHGRRGNLLGSVIVFRDVTEARRATRELVHHAIHDPLTGLVNRREFEQRLKHAITGSKSRGAQHALCYIDLDQFKIVNDTVGHVAGDELLRQITNLLLDNIRDRDTLARLGGDEFGLLLDNCPQDKAMQIAESLVAEVRDHRFVWEGRPFLVGASVGMVAITGAADNAIELLGQADMACYGAKEQGRNRVCLYQGEGCDHMQRHTEMMRAADLSAAMEEDRLLLYYQPIVALLEDDDLVHYELLLRLQNADGNIVLPAAFIPAAERYGSMPSLDRWVIQTAFQRYAATFGGNSTTEISINLSGNSLNDPALLEFVRQQFAATDLSPQRVCFDISETAAIRNLSQAQRFIHTLKQEGCRFALDDFGSGLSSFTYLKKLPVDYLKIDGAFVREMLENPLDHAMVEAIRNIGHVLGIRIIAESVENEAIVTRLRDLGVDFAQGYGLGSPVPLADLAA